MLDIVAVAQALIHTAINQEFIDYRHQSHTLRAVGAEPFTTTDIFATIVWGWTHLVVKSSNSLAGDASLCRLTLVMLLYQPSIINFILKESAVSTGCVLYKCPFECRS